MTDFLMKSNPPSNEKHTAILTKVEIETKTKGDEAPVQIDRGEGTEAPGRLKKKAAAGADRIIFRTDYAGLPRDKSDYLGS
jgi:hypothetical protein